MSRETPAEQLYEMGKKLSEIITAGFNGLTEEEAQEVAFHIVYDLRQRFGWSSTILTKDDACSLWSGYHPDELNEQGKALFEAFWERFRYTKGWREAWWSDSSEASEAVVDSFIGENLDLRWPDDEEKLVGRRRPHPTR